MDKFADLIQRGQRFLLTTHTNPDGDGLGSQMALHFYLKKVGKLSHVINPGPTPDKFALVDPRGEIRVHRSGEALPPVDAIFVLDTNDEKMLGPMLGDLKVLKAPMIFLDHHVPENIRVEDHLIDERYAATGELVYELLRFLRADIDREMALALYVAIVSDTGGFRYKRTSARSHHIAAELLQKGVAPETVFQNVYARNSLAKTRLFGHLLERIQVSADSRIAWIAIDKATRERYGATVEDTEAFVNQLTLLEGVDVALMFREEEDGRIKVSLRGMGEVAVVGIARSFGGGGHRHAAGMRVSLPMDEAIRQVTEAAREVLKQYPRP